MNHGGTQNFYGHKAGPDAAAPSVQAIRIGRTKPYDCSYPVIAGDRGSRKGARKMAIKPILFNTEMVRAILDGPEDLHP